MALTRTAATGEGGLLEAALAHIAAALAARPGVERVILFGSYARGDAGADSDLDLLVVVGQAESVFHAAADLRRAIRGCEYPVDLLVRTRSQIREYEEDGDFFFARVRREGRVLYAREGT